MSKKTEKPKEPSNQVPNRDEFIKLYLPFALSTMSKYGSIENYLMQNPAFALLISSTNLSRNSEHLNNWLEKQFGVSTDQSQLSRNKLLDLCDQIVDKECTLSGHSSENSEDSQ